MPESPGKTELGILDDVATALVARGIGARDEAALRRELERHVEGYNPVRLTRAASRRWGCHTVCSAVWATLMVRVPLRSMRVPCSLRSTKPDSAPNLPLAPQTPRGHLRPAARCHHVRVRLPR